MRAHAHLLKLAGAGAAALLTLSLPAAAQEAAFAPRAEPPAPSAEEGVSKAELMAQAGGRVVVYVDGEGLPYGEEYFDPNGLKVIWRYLDGGCQEASWTAEGSLFCFAYDSPSCWRVRGDEEGLGEWTAHLVSPDEDRGQWVRMVGFEERKLQCDADFIAMAQP